MPATAFFVERVKKGYQISSMAKKAKLNGKAVKGKAMLKDDDEITIGSTTLRFLFVG